MPAETLTDEQILGLDDSPAPEVSSEAPETSAPVETQPEEIATETPLKPGQAKDETTAQPKQADKTQQQAKPTTEQSQDANTVNAEKAAELDRADAAFTNSDYAAMAETFTQMFGENPHALSEAMWMGRRFLEQKAPQELAAFSRFVVSEELGKQGLWDFLEQAFSQAQTEQERAAWNRLAGFFNQGYGLGSASPDTQEVSWQNYTKNVGALMEQNVDAGIKRAFGAEFSAVPPQLQEELMTAAGFAVKDLLLKDRNLGPALQKLRSGYTTNDGVNLFLDVIDPKVRAILPGIAQHLKTQYSDLFKKLAAPTRGRIAALPAPAKAESTDAPLGLDESRGMSISEILSSMRPADRTARTRPRPEKLSKQEARNMTFAQIINDDREVASQ